MSFLSRATHALGRTLTRASTALFGRLAWTPPGYLRATGAAVGAGWRAAALRPAVSTAAFVLALSAIGGGWFGWKWWQQRPKPVEVTFSVTAPTRTPIENEDDNKPRPLVVQFQRGVAPLPLIGKDVPDGFDIAPALAGTWHWTSDRVLTFQPKDDWPVGTDYTVRVGRKAVSPQIRLAKWEIPFSSPAFTATLSKTEFYQDPTNPTVKSVTAELQFSHPVDPASLEPRVSLKMAGAKAGVLGIGAEKTKFTISYDKLKLTAYIRSEDLPIPAEAASLNVVIGPGITAQRGGNPSAGPLNGSVAIPGRYSLTLDTVDPTVVSNPQNDPEQVLVLETSQTVSERDVAKFVSAWELPVLHPARKAGEDATPYPWSDPSEITQAILDHGRKIALEAIPAEQEQSRVHSFKYSSDVGRYVYVQVEKNLKSFGGYLLAAREQRIVRVPPFPPELRILSQGALLALSGEKKVAVLVRDLPGVRVEVGRVLPDQLQHLVSQSSGRFDSPEFGGSFGEDNLVERFERKVPLPGLQRGRAHYEALDLGEFLRKDGENKRGVFLLSVSGYDPETDKPGNKADDAAANNAEPDDATADAPDNGAGDAPAPDDAGGDQNPAAHVDKRLVLITDLGILVKRELDGTQVVFVQSIHTGQPVADATVEVVGKNGLTIASQATDAQGAARFAKLENLGRERAPLMYLVKKGADLSFLPLNRGDRALDTSRFDVGGVANARQADQLSAYLFSDRGIYRPGDTFHIGMIIKSAGWTKPAAKPLAGVPLEVEVLDARGLRVQHDRIRVAAGGFNELSHTTLASSPTGSYRVNLYTVKDGMPNQQIGSTQVEVREFEPDRMKVSAHLSTEVAEGWVSPRDLKAMIQVQNLFGTPAADRRIETTLTLSSAYPSFRGQPGYTFYDPQRAKDSYTEKLADAKTDAKGEADVDLKLEKYASATYRLHVLARAFEPESGRSVAAEIASMVSSRPYLVGVKADGALDYIARGAKRELSVVAIDPKAARIAVPGLRLQFIERKFVSVLIKQDSGLYKYESRKKEVTLQESPLSVAATGSTVALATDVAGNFAYVVKDEDGVELNRVEYSVAGQGNVSRSLDRNAELQLVLDRKDYAPGDEIAISIRAPYTGAGLITIERDKVYAQQWFKTDTLASVQRIRVPKDFEGNGYVSVQFVRDPSSDEIFMSPLSWGIVPFATSLSQRTQSLRLETPDLVKPGQKLTIRLGADAPTRAAVFAVDEGILQVARYQNADPLGYLFPKHALDVRTSQILDMILPEFSKLMAAAAPGGDAEAALGQHLNPFKRKHDLPAVYWSGIVDVQGSREFTWVVPDTFSGSLRVMAVAVNDTQIGTAVGKTLARGDFVLSPNAPLAVSPGDEFDVSVGVANNVAGSGPDAAVQVSLEPANAFEVVGPRSVALKIGELREGVGSFRVKARDGNEARLGSARLAFTASLGEKSARLSTDVSVRPATPHYTQLGVGSFKGSIDVPVTRDLHAEFRQVEAAVSVLPLVVAGGLSSYLADYEHACTEQLASQMVPAIVLARRPEFAPAVGSVKAGRSVADAIGLLRTRQNADGGFGLWAASINADEFASVHAIQVLLEARDHGERVPDDMLKAGLGYLGTLAQSPARDLFSARTRAQAAYLLTREGMVTTAMLTSLRQMLDARYPKAWTNDIAAAWLAASYQLLKQQDLADTLIAGPADLLRQREAPFAYADYYDPMVRDAVTLYVLARHFPDRARRLSPDTMLAMVKPIADNQFNTVSAGWMILALDAYANTVAEKGGAKLSIDAIDAAGNASPLPLPNNLIPRAAFAATTAKLRFGTDSDLNAYYAVTETGFDRKPPAAEVRNGFELLREYVDASGKPVTKVTVGDEVVVRLRFRTNDRPYLDNLVLVDLLPGGFEPVLHSQAAPAQPGNDTDGAAPGAWVNPLAEGPGEWGADYADVRDDRVVLYGRATQDFAQFSYRIKATSAGTFIVPPAYGESMYERGIQARTAAGTIVVEKPAH
jgi:uncharacterized protein YfaS (alpha-2-macroglobulin family)